MSLKPACLITLYDNNLVCLLYIAMCSRVYFYSSCAIYMSYIIITNYYYYHYYYYYYHYHYYYKLLLSLLLSLLLLLFQERLAEASAATISSPASGPTSRPSSRSSSTWTRSARSTVWRSRRPPWCSCRSWSASTDSSRGWAAHSQSYRGCVWLIDKCPAEWCARTHRFAGNSSFCQAHAFEVWTPIANRWFYSYFLFHLFYLFYFLPSLWTNISTQ